MTGYGKAEITTGTKKITVEIRSLNSKQLDLTVKLPSIYRQCEYDIRSEAARRLQRGKVDIYVSYETAAGANTVSINGAAFADYLRQLSEIAAAAQVDMADAAVKAALMPAILRLPEVVQNDTSAVSEEELEALMAAVRGALDRIDEFRIQEGAILIADLLRRIDRIEAYKAEVEPYEKQRTETIRARIRENIASMGIEIDRNRLEQEMIFYIEKLDVTEEKVRLTNHCKYFREVAAGEEAPGRKLGFIAQEIGREINTLGSKSNEANMQKIVVGMKDELEKIKEQVLNLL
ncbi:MAG: YicC family protein [Rikenellaceae bacterium]|nr:YicC family protein [Rikenellaceae bacterium]